MAKETARKEMVPYILWRRKQPVLKRREREKELLRMTSRVLACAAWWLEVSFKNMWRLEVWKALRYESRAELGYVKFGDSDISKWRCYVIGYANLKLRGNSYNCWVLHSPENWGVDKWFLNHKPNLIRFGLWLQSICEVHSLF